MSTVFIMRGLPGSGKSTEIQKRINKYVEKYLDRSSIKRLYNDCVCSADHYFMRDGVYTFDPAQLGDAHSKCLRKYLELLREYESPIFVDNTNLTMLEMAPYVALADVYGYSVIMVEMVASVQECVSRNIHGVPPYTIERMASSMEKNYPPFWNVETQVILKSRRPSHLCDG